MNINLSTVNITQDVLNKPYYKYYYLIELALMQNQISIVKKILKVDGEAYKHVSQFLLCNMSRDLHLDLIVEFLELLNKQDQASILLPSSEDWFVPIFFRIATPEQIIKFIKFPINYSIYAYGKNILMYYMYNILDDAKLNNQIDIKLFKKILILSKPLIQKYQYEFSPIIDVCIHQFNKKLLDTFLKVYPDGLDMFNDYYNTSTLIEAIKYRNQDLFNYIINYYKKTNKHDYNYIGYSTAIFEALELNDNISLNILMGLDNIDVNIHNKFRNTPAHLIFLDNTNNLISIENKKEILRKTKNINIQNLDGNTVLHLICEQNLLSEYRNILEKKLCDIFICNIVNSTPIQCCKDVELLLQITTTGFINNTHKMQIDNVICLPKLKYKNKNIRNDTYKCLKNQSIKILFGSMPKNIKQVNNITFISEPNVDYILYHNQITDIYIYTMYYVEIFGIKLLESADLNLNLNCDTERCKYYANHLIGFKNLQSICIYWYDPNECIIMTQLNHKISKLKKGIYFINLILMQKTNSHVNGLIIDIDKRIIIRFEPHGIHNNKSTVTFDEMFQKICDEINYVYVTPIDFLSTNSFQTLSNEERLNKVGDPGGYCLTWTFWFLELYLKNRKTNIKLLESEAIKRIINSKQTFSEYIRAYANKLVNYRFKFLTKIKYPAKKILNVNYNIDESNLIFDKLNKIS